jgi:multicomponent Na+:H+ antiporter subunit C
MLAIILLLLGVYCVIAKKNLVKILIGMIIIENAVNLMLVLIGYRTGGLAPILSKTEDMVQQVCAFVDPLPQALVVTSLVIGLGTTALMVSICLRLHEKYGTFDILQIRRLKG